eukprot:Em0023g749a
MGYLVSRCNTKLLCLWDLRNKVFPIRHELQFETERAGSDQPGDVISIEEHPGDQKKVLFAYAGGLCALWNVQEKKCEKKYNFDPGQTEILTSVSWSGNGRTFACSYSDGRIVMWNSKNDAKPEKNYKVHENVKTVTPQKPIFKLQLVYTEGNTWIVYMGGYPEESKDAPLTLTISNGGKHSTLLSTSSTIVDFLCLPSSPYTAEAQKPFLLLILTETELLARDLSVPGYPSFILPYSFDFHIPPVTCLQYYAGAPDELVASLLSARSKVPTRGNPKTWPLHGGKWGEETPDLPTDLIITGHANGTINLWQCNSVSFQHFFSINTEKYFALCSPQAKPTPQSAPSTPMQTPEKSLINAPPNAAIVSRSISMPVENDVHLPANSSASVFYTLSPAPALPQASTLSTPSPTPADTKHGDGRTTPGGGAVPQGSSEDEIDGHRKKKKGGGSGSKSMRRKDQKVKSIPEGQASPEKEELGESVLDILSTEPGEGGGRDDVLGISEIEACPLGWWMCVTNVGGNVMAFNFNLTLPEEALKPHSLCINFDENTLSKLSKAPGSEADTAPPPPPAGRKYKFKTCLDGPPLPGFYLVQHCQCSSSDGVVVCAMQYSTKLGLLAIGTKQGLAVVDVVSNQLLHVLNTLTTILYFADPSQFSKQLKKGTSKKLVSRVSTKMLDQHTLPPPTRTHTPPSSSSSSSDLISLSLNTVQEQDSSVTVLRVVQMMVDKNGTLAAVLWVGTTNGDVAAFVVSEALGSQDGSPRKMELLPTRWIHNHGAPIVNLLFLNKWGDLKLVPYTNGAQNKKKGEDDQPTYCVVVTANKLKVYTCEPSGMTQLQKVPTGAAVLKSDYFTCKDLPCLFSLMDDGKMLVHSLPGLKPLMESTFAPLHDPRVTCTLRVSGDSLGVYMSSETQLERISIAAVDRLNLPLSLPDVFGKIDDPQPPGKGIMGYFTTPQEFDKEKLFGEGAGRPLPSLAKRDGQSGYSVAYHKHQKVTPRSQASEPVHEAAAQADNTNDQIQLNRRLLEERREKLSEVEEKASRLQDGASDFARLAEKLSKKERGLL